MNQDSAAFVRAIKGPIILITIGTLFALENFTPFGFGQTWPVLLIVIGILSLGGKSGKWEGKASYKASWGPTPPPPPRPTPPPPPPPPFSGTSPAQPGSYRGSEYQANPVAGSPMGGTPPPVSEPKPAPVPHPDVLSAASSGPLFEPSKPADVEHPTIEQRPGLHLSPENDPGATQ